MGYQVHEEYMEEAKAHAKARSVPGSGPYMFGLGPWPDMGMQSFEAISEQFMRAAMMWFEYVARAGQRAAPPPPAELAEKSQIETGFSVAIVSRRQIEVTLDVKEAAKGRNLGVQELRSPDADLPVIQMVVVEYDAEDGKWRAQVAIDDEQPRGVYTGVVYDREAGLPVGTLAVTVA
jgi:hypothetical protein